MKALDLAKGALGTVLAVLEKASDADLKYLGITPEERDTMLVQSYELNYCYKSANTTLVNLNSVTEEKVALTVTQNFEKDKTSYAQQLGTMAYHAKLASGDQNYWQKKKACEFQARFNQYVTPLTQGDTYYSEDTLKQNPVHLFASNVCGMLTNTLRERKAKQINKSVEKQEQRMPGPRVQKSLNDLLKNTHYNVFEYKRPIQYGPAN